MVTAGAAFVVWAAIAAAQNAAPAAPAPPAHVSKFGIPDNSFLIEEAFNQEKGIVQNIVVFTRTRHGNWDASFGQEWPLGGERHQIAFTIPFAAAGGARATIGDIDLSYRLKVSGGDHRAPAFTPELSFIVPSSPERRGDGFGGAGWAVSLPFSKELDRLFLHLNAGNEWQRESGGTFTWRSTPFVAGSAVIAVRPMVNLMLEVYNEWQPGDSGRERSTTISPGIRFGWNTAKDTQVVVGVGAPITRGAIRDRGVLLYFSYELPFTKNR